MLSAAAPPPAQLNLTSNSPSLQRLNTTPLFSESNLLKDNTGTRLTISNISINVPNTSTRLEIGLRSFLELDSISLLLGKTAYRVELEIGVHGGQARPRSPVRCYSDSASLEIRNQPGRYMTLLVLKDIMEGLYLVLVRGGIETQARFDVYHDGVFVAKGQLHGTLAAADFCSSALGS